MGKLHSDAAGSYPCFSKKILASNPGQGYKGVSKALRFQQTEIQMVLAKLNLCPRWVKRKNIWYYEDCANYQVTKVSQLVTIIRFITKHQTIYLQYIVKLYNRRKSNFSKNVSSN